MRAKEFIVEYKLGQVEEFQGVDMKLETTRLGAIVVKALDDWGNEIARAHFHDMDGDFIEAQSLWVEPEFRGQGVARKMYDFVTSHGYEIHKSPDVTKIKDQGKQSGEHHWQKNRGEETIWEDDESRTEKFQGVPMKITELDDEVEIKALDSQGNKVLGHVTFSRFHDDLEAKYVEVDERYRGQGIAQLMYDFATNHGYKIQRSYDQTDAGAGFWGKHRGEETVWEDELTEAFDDPYHIKWEKSDFGDYDAIATLDDGTYLNIMFNNEGDEEWQVEFHRNHSQEVSGEGDAQRVFATVLAAIQQFIQKQQPWRLIFSASKDNWAKQQQNSESRASLYTKLVQRYARAWGYDEYDEDHGDQVTYELTKLKAT